MAKEKLVTLTLKVPPAVNERVLALSEERGGSVLNKSQVARQALLLGLQLIEQDRALLSAPVPAGAAEAAPPAPKKSRGK